MRNQISLNEVGDDVRSLKLKALRADNGSGENKIKSSVTLNPPF